MHRRAPRSLTSTLHALALVLRDAADSPEVSEARALVAVAARSPRPEAARAIAQARRLANVV